MGFISLWEDQFLLEASVSRVILARRKEDGFGLD